MPEYSVTAQISTAAVARNKLRCALTIHNVSLVLAALVLSGRASSAHAQIDQQYFEQTGFCIEGRILDFWNAGGGLTTFGYPIGPQQDMTIEGKTITGQWFERMRIELHAENVPPYNVLSGLLGREPLDAQVRPVAPPATPERQPSRVCTATPRGERSVQRAGVQITAASFNDRDKVGGVQSSADDDFLKLTVSVVNTLYRQCDGSPGRIFANIDSFQLVDSQGRAYSRDGVTNTVGDRFVSGQVRPGEARTGMLVFRLPKDAVPQQLVYDGRVLNANYPKIRLDLRWPGARRSR